MKLLQALFALSLAATVHAEKKPNILWLITDDQRADSVAAFNQATTGKSESALGYVLSPNLDRLAKEGVLFTRAYCNSPGCAPSRTSMITGRYPHRNGMYGFNRSHDQTDFFRPVIPQLMKSQGYSTLNIGKFGYRIFQWKPGLSWDSLGFYDVETQLSDGFWKKGKTDFYTDQHWTPEKTTRTTKFFFDDGRQVSFEESTPTEKDKEAKRKIIEELDLLYSYTRSNKNLILGGVSPRGSDGTIDAHIVKEFQSHLKAREANNTEEPLFTHLGFHLPHTPVLPPKEYRDKFAGKTYKVPAFDKEKELSKLPPQLVSFFKQLNFADLKDDEKQQAIRDYYAFCAFGDSLIGKAVESFKAHSEAQGRPWLCLIVCGDHGWHLGEQGIEAKFGPYDKSNRCTVIALSSDKSKFPAGKVYDEFVEFVDFAPTMLQSAGLDLKSKEAEHLDGLELSSLVSGKIKARDYAIGEMHAVMGPRAYLRTKEYAFSMKTRPFFTEIGAKNPGENVKWGLEAPINEVEPALFDLTKDPDERFNVAADPAYAKITEALRKKLANIVLGDGRIECKWAEKNTFFRSTFALGAHDYTLKLPE